MPNLRSVIFAGVLAAFSCSCGVSKALLSSSVAPSSKDQPPQLSAQEMTGVNPTVPSISRSGTLLDVSAGAVRFSLDLTRLLDVDNNFNQIGDGPDMNHDAAVYSAAIQGLFAMGYFDSAGPVTQEDVDSALDGAYFTRPIKVMEPGVTDHWEDVVMALHGDGLVGAASLMESQGGTFTMGEVERSQGRRFASLAASFPALTRESAIAAYEASGYSAQDIVPESLLRVRSAALGGGGPLAFYWVKDCESSPEAIGAAGQIFSLGAGLSVQSLDNPGVGDAVEVGRVQPSEAEHGLLEERAQ